MTKQVLFVQGGGDGTHDDWDNKLVESLSKELGPGYEIRYPVMPNEANPSYAAWKAVLEREIAMLRPGAIFVGHSVGGTILINVLAELAPKRAGAIFLIAAPFVGEGGWSSEDIEPRPDVAIRLPKGVPVFLYHGSEDEIAPFAHVGLYAETIPGAHVRCLHGRDHQLNNNLSEVANDIRELD
jgi:predicted alpha/beta hydrolase family esterase